MLLDNGAEEDGGTDGGRRIVRTEKRNQRGSRRKGREEGVGGSNVGRR